VGKAWEVAGLRGSVRFRRAAGRVVLTRWREMMSYREGTLLGEDVEELHAMRVSSRRLRAAMDAFAGAFPERSFRPYVRRVKEITDTLGAARDLDVAVEGLEALVAELPEDERPGVDGLVARLRADRVAETPRIAALFARLDDEGFAARFERYLTRRSGVDVRRLDPRPPEAAR
jgi:CHAD domain-containing protein